MNMTSNEPSGGTFPWLRLFRAEGPRKPAEQADRAAGGQDRETRDRAEAETFWAGRNLAMRRSARVAA